MGSQFVELMLGGFVLSRSFIEHKRQSLETQNGL